jgi:hypothetical protein
MTADTVAVYVVPDPVLDSGYTVYADGLSVPIERAATLQPAYYVRLRLAGQARVEVRASRGTTFELAPERLIHGRRLADGAISFVVSEPGPRVVSARRDGRALPPLFCIADRYEGRKPAPEAGHVIDVSQYGVSPDRLQTDAIQRALDECAQRPDGGTVYFGPGVYRSGAIRVGDNTSIYMAAGALVVGSEDPADYAERDRCLILFDHCTDSSLRGHGVVDGRGHILRNGKGMSGHLVNAVGCRNLTIENLVLRNSPAWCVHLVQCNEVRIDNLKVMGDWGVANTDGINPDCSQNVRITRYFGYCGDDAIAIKTTLRMGGDQPSRNIVVRDSVVMTRKTALKLGTESRRDITDVVFENIDVVHSSRGIGLWMRDGFTFSNVTFRDIRMGLREIDGESMSGEPYRAVIRDRAGIGKIKGVRFERIRSRAPYRSLFQGMAESPLQDFTFRDCLWEIASRTIKMDKKPVMAIEHARDFAFHGCRFTWTTDQRDVWDALVREKDAENITFDPRPTPPTWMAP